MSRLRKLYSHKQGKRRLRGGTPGSATVTRWGTTGNLNKSQKQYVRRESK